MRIRYNEESSKYELGSYLYGYNSSIGGLDSIFEIVKSFNTYREAREELHYLNGGDDLLKSIHRELIEIRKTMKRMSNRLY